MSVLTVAAPAKLNLYLHVTGRRPDGYHTLDSLVAFAGIQDMIRVEESRGLTLDIEGPFKDDVPHGEKNIVLQAALALREKLEAPMGAKITLVKRLPVASGLGGGSADAAATLSALMQLWKDAPVDDELMALALKLGADVPVCLAGLACFVGGIGEELTPAPKLPESWVVLVNPGVALSTPSVFAAREGDFSKPNRFDYAPADSAELAAILAERTNDLHAPALTMAPVIGDVLKALKDRPGCRLARMSGSGATCFALFDTADTAIQATMALDKGHPGWWVKTGSLICDTGTLSRPAP